MRAISSQPWTSSTPCCHRVLAERFGGVSCDATGGAFSSEQSVPSVEVGLLEPTGGEAGTRVRLGGLQSGQLLTYRLDGALLRDLPPGAYTVKLTATDIAGRSLARPATGDLQVIAVADDFSDALD